MSCARTGSEASETDCHICNFCEREAVKKTASFQTVMPVECLYCRKIYDFKDGLGNSQITSGICPVCLPGVARP